MMSYASQAACLIPKLEQRLNITITPSLTKTRLATVAIMRNATGCQNESNECATHTLKHLIMQLNGLDICVYLASFAKTPRRTCNLRTDGDANPMTPSLSVPSRQTSTLCVPLALAGLRPFGRIAGRSFLRLPSGKLGGLFQQDLWKSQVD
jgi:hypothetical protein